VYPINHASHCVVIRRRFPVENLNVVALRYNSPSSSIQLSVSFCFHQKIQQYVSSRNKAPALLHFCNDLAYVLGYCASTRTPYGTPPCLRCLLSLFDGGVTQFAICLVARETRSLPCFLCWPESAAVTTVVDFDVCSAACVGSTI